MHLVECEFEPEVLAAVLQSRWPFRVDPQLRAHVEHCPVCSDVAAIAGVIDSAREETRALAVVPSAGRVWFLAQLRARREAARAAARPIAVTQLVAAAACAGVLGACFGASSTGFQAWLEWLGTNFAGFDALHQIAEHGALALGAAAVLFLVPAAAWLAARRH